MIINYQTLLICKTKALQDFSFFRNENNESSIIWPRLNTNEIYINKMCLWMTQCPKTMYVFQSTVLTALSHS